MKNKPLIVGALLCGAWAVYGVAAQAGSKTAFPIVIDTAQRVFTGSIGSIRNSANATDSLKCSITAAGLATCTATGTVNGVVTTVSCSTNDAVIVKNLRSMDSDSWVSIRYDVSSTCTETGVAKGSQYAPKVL